MSFNQHKPMYIHYLTTEPKGSYSLVAKGWDRISKAGAKYIIASVGVKDHSGDMFNSVVLEPKDTLVILPNKHKTKEKSPDFLIFVKKNELRKTELA